MTVLAAELAKLPAFVRRDLLVALSYRAVFLSDLVVLFTQALLFAFVGRMVDPTTLPEYGGRVVGYVEFVAVGIAVGAFIQLGLGRVAAALRAEQMLGTFETILATPTSLTTLQLGSVVFDLIYVPLRTAAFLVFAGWMFGFDLRLEGLLPATLVLLVLIPFVWGLGILGAAAVVTFRRGIGATGIAGTLLAFGSGAYFPLDLFPAWAQTLAELNPIATSLEAIRTAVLGDAGWASAAAATATVGPAAVISLLAGSVAFRLAMRRERRLGTVGLY